MKRLLSLTRILDTGEHAPIALIPGYFIAIAMIASYEPDQLPQYRTELTNQTVSELVQYQDTGLSVLSAHFALNPYVVKSRTPAPLLIRAYDRVEF